MLGMQHGGPIGYTPLQLGQVFEDLEGGQYEIVRKLGWATTQASGSQSTNSTPRL